jgi:hypothetical protein
LEEEQLRQEAERIKAEIAQQAAIIRENQALKEYGDHMKGKS